MKQKRVITEGSKNIITCIGIGLAAAVLISLILTIGLTSLIQKGNIAENGNLGVIVIRAVSTLVGCLLGTGLAKKKILPVIGAISGGYFTVLLITGLLLLDGSLNQVWQGILSVIIGGAIACLIKLKPQRTRRKAVHFAS